jgi:hypothetical protein
MTATSLIVLPEVVLLVHTTLVNAQFSPQTTLQSQPHFSPLNHTSNEEVFEKQ